MSTPTASPRGAPLMIRPGLYQHYKGPQYRVIGTARHSETEEFLVVYYCVAPPLAALSSQACSSILDLSSLGEIWVRPATMFAESVVIDGNTAPRFKRLGD